MISNSIKRVPESISLLKKLSGLYLSRNCIRELPNSLVECYSLRELYLDHNHLQYIPGSLVKLRELALLSLSGTQENIPHFKNVFFFKWLPAKDATRMTWRLRLSWHSALKFNLLHCNKGCNKNIIKLKR